MTSRKRFERSRPWAAVFLAGVAALAGAAIATSVSWHLEHENPWIALAMHLGGLPSITIGFVVWLRGRAARVGQLMLAVGASYYLMDLRASSNAVVFGIGFCLAYLWAAVVTHLALVLPTGRPAGRLERVLIAVCYVAAVGTQIGRYVSDHPRPPWAYDIPHVNTTWAKFSSLVVVVLGLLIVGTLTRRWLAATGIRRRPFTALWVVVIVSAALGIWLSMASFLDASVKMQTVLLLAMITMTLAIVPAVSLIQVVRLNLTRWRLASMTLNVEHALDAISLDVPTGRWPREIEFTSYFVIAEALANVNKHARASHVTVTVCPETTSLTVAIRDNGCGGVEVGGGMGLRGLHDRVAAVGGQLDVVSESGTGTQIVARLPLQLR